MKVDVNVGLDKFSNLLNSLKKKKNPDRLNMSSFLSPTAGEGSLSPNRHWKRGLGREGTPNSRREASVDLGHPESVRNSKILPDLKNAPVLDIDEVIKFLSHAVASLTENEMVTLLYRFFRLSLIVE